MQFDGGKQGSTGMAGCGWILMDVANNEQVVAKGWKYLGKGLTSNIAEYYGLIEGLKFLVGQQVLAGRIHIQGAKYQSDVGDL